MTYLNHKNGINFELIDMTFGELKNCQISEISHVFKIYIFIIIVELHVHDGMYKHPLCDELSQFLFGP